MEPESERILDLVGRPKRKSKHCQISSSKILSLVFQQKLFFNLVKAFLFTLKVYKGVSTLKYTGKVVDTLSNFEFKKLSLVF